MVELKLEEKYLYNLFMTPVSFCLYPILPYFQILPPLGLLSKF